MSADTESFVVAPSGPMHSGSGNQFNNPVFVLDSHERLVRVGRDPRVLMYEHLHWLHQRFVEPDHYDKARELLADSGSVLLTGAPGSGRRATAQMLLHQLDTKSAELIRELPDADPGGSSEGPVLDAHVVDSGQRLLLDLSTSEETACEVVLGQLPWYRDEARQRGAHLVVVLPRGRERYSELGPSIVEIVRPNGRHVFQRYLRSADIKPTSAELDVDDLTTQLHSEPMQHIADLARLVQDAKESEPTKTFPYWLRESLTKLTERSDEVAEQMKALRTGQSRALLLTSAMFSGAHADAVFAATSGLCGIVQQPTDDRPRLEQEDLAERLAEIKVKADDAGRVHFRQLAYDSAVRTYFWTNFPNLREDFHNWVGIALVHQNLRPEDRDAVVGRFAEQALRTGRPEDLCRLVERWARRIDGGRPSRLLPQAARAVELGLHDERHGAFFRSRLLTWSREPSLPHDLAQVVVKVCSEVLALTHPEQAVVRLHHIVRRHRDTAGEAARAALHDLVRHNRRLYCRLLDRVTTGLSVPYYEAADLLLFLDLVTWLTDSPWSTEVIIEDRTVRDQLVIGWNAVLRGPFPVRCTEWLVSYADDRDCEVLLDVLVEAGDGRSDLFGRLHVIARDWAHASDDRRAERIEIADRLNNKIDFAQGLDFTEVDLKDRTERTAP